MARNCYTVAEVVGTSSATEAFLTASPVTQSLFPTKYETPSGLPAGGTMIAGFQIRMHTVTNSSGGWRVWTMDPTTAFGIPGTWSGVSGGDGANPGEFYIDGWDYWVTEYLSRSGSSGASGAQSAIGYHSSFEQTELDVRIRLRMSDWSEFVDAAQSQILVARESTDGGTQGPWKFSRYKASPSASDWSLNWIQFASSGSGVYIYGVSGSALGLTNGQWTWLRVVATTSGATIYKSSDGVNWTAITGGVSAGTPGSIWTGSGVDINVGALPLNSTGLHADISDVELRTVSGSLITDYGLVSMTSSTDLSWVTSTGRDAWRASTGVVANGSALGSGNPTFMFDTPIALDQFTVFMDNVNDGSYEIDEWCLDYITDDGWSVGFLKF